MRVIITVLKVAEFATGLIAAWYWYRSSKVDYNFMKKLTGKSPSIEEQYSHYNPKLDIMNTAISTKASFRQAAQLNKTAALWTAASVALSVASTIIGALASN